jgi:hypothetical protein
MATYDLNRSELNHVLVSDGIDPTVRAAVINYLNNDNLLDDKGSTVAVQEDNHPAGNYPPLDPNTQVLVLTSPSGFVDTSTDPNLEVIVGGGDAHLTVTGSSDLLIAAGKGVNLVDLSGTTGNEAVVVGGSSSGGGDSGGSHNSDPWAGNDGAAGSNQQDNQGSNGHFDTIAGGSEDLGHGGHDHGSLWGDNGNYSTLGGGGNEGWHAGGNDPPHGNGNGGDSGGTTTIIAGSGNDTLVGGNENDLFVVGRQGNDLIDGGGGSNTVQFDDSFANAKILNLGGVTTVDFKDTGQSVTMTEVQELVFTGHHDVKV